MLLRISFFKNKQTNKQSSLEKWREAYPRMSFLFLYKYVTRLLLVAGQLPTSNQFCSLRHNASNLNNTVKFHLFKSILVRHHVYWQYMSQRSYHSNCFISQLDRFLDIGRPTFYFSTHHLLMAILVVSIYWVILGMVDESIIVHKESFLNKIRFYSNKLKFLRRLFVEWNISGIFMVTDFFLTRPNMGLALVLLINLLEWSTENRCHREKLGR